MDKVIDVQEVQDELDRAARDAKHGPADIRAGRFVHRNATSSHVSAGKTTAASSTPERESKQAS
jgi:hypothetical protein